MSKKIFSITAVVSLLIACCLSAVGAGVNKKVLVFLNKRNTGDMVVTKVVDTLKKDGCSVKLESGAKLHGSSVSKYNAIVVFNFVAKGQKDKSVKVYAGEDEQKRIVLFNAVGADYLEPESGSTDTKETKAEKLALKIVDNVKEVLLKQ